jgi:hypothetical protein
LPYLTRLFQLSQAKNDEDWMSGWQVRSPDRRRPRVGWLANRRRPIAAIGKPRLIR